MKLPEEIREQFGAWGQKGGQERARRLSSAKRSSIARLAALRRWIHVRFGEASFAQLNIPGGSLIDSGIEDLSLGRESVASLVVSLAAPRLRREHVPLPAKVIEDADHRLYLLLEESGGLMAHSRYLANLNEVLSFADACHLFRIDTSRDAK